MAKLFQGLSALNDAAEIVGAARRSAKLVVGRQDELVQVPRKYKSIIQDLIAEQRAPEFWEMLTRLQPDLAAHLADAEIQRTRRGALRPFKSTWARWIGMNPRGSASLATISGFSGMGYGTSS